MNNMDYRGAESKLFVNTWCNLEAISKVRQIKTYRIEELDFQFRKKRTVYEARLLTRAKDAGVRVPVIYEIDIENTTLVLEYLKGEILKTLIPKSDEQTQAMLGKKIGYNVGLLHNSGIVHGDLTTSNIIKLQGKEQLAFIDFGLGYISERIEDFGIDVYLLERAINSTHNESYEIIWTNFIAGYKETSPYKDQIEEKVAEISSRGRYSERM